MLSIGAYCLATKEFFHFNNDPDGFSNSCRIYKNIAVDLHEPLFSL